MKRKQLRGERGGATVEFAIIAVLLLTVVFGIIEFGIVMFDQHVLTNASREGARAGVVMQVPRVTDTQIKDVVKNYAMNYMITFSDTSALNWDDLIQVDPPDVRPQVSFGTPLEVTVTYPFKFLVLSNFGLGPISLKAKTRMNME
jgi:Flp pilus assembly protein TadG